jgi:prepilin signal peptidase PulO-like enzyme (type II secretory pathway)
LTGDSDLDPELAALDDTAAAEPAPLLRHRTSAALLALAAAALAFASYDPGAKAILAAFFAGTLVVVAATDIERRIIPNRVVLPATVIVLLAQVVIAPRASLQFLLAATTAGAVFLLPSLAGRSWMGAGDVKLIALLGAGLGAGVMGALMLAFLLIFPVAVTVLVRRGRAARKATLPFGPFLALAALIILIVPRMLAAG